MSGWVLIDTSVWIETVKGRGPEADTLRAEVTGLLELQRAALAPPVWLELFQGVRDKRGENDLSTLRSVAGWLEFDENCWRLAAETGRQCLRQGVVVPQSDLLIHACARRHQARLLHRDHHFDLIDKAIR